MPHDAALLELLASYRAALEAAHRSLTIAQALADGYRSGVHPPAVVLEAYTVTVERDRVLLTELRDKVQQSRPSQDALMTAIYARKSTEQIGVAKRSGRFVASRAAFRSVSKRRGGVRHPKTRSTGRAPPLMTLEP